MKKRSKLTIFLCLLLCVTMIIGALPVIKSEAGETETGNSVPTIGDLDGDGFISAKDVTMLRRYLAGGWNVFVDEEKADIDRDKKVTAKDVTLLRRYLAGGWGVVLPGYNNSESTPDGVAVSRNASEQNYYGNNAKRINSYLYVEDNNFYRVEALWESYDNEKYSIVIEEYDLSWRLKSSKKIEFEEGLIWGGFYQGKTYNFIVLGQSNLDEDDNKMVLRVIRYDKTWNECGSVDLCGANTTYPFDCGLRFTELDGYLYVHTCHTMYTSADGIRHQANMTVSIKEDPLEIAWAGYDFQLGYVSHSLNQYIIADSDKHIVLLDHGDNRNAFIQIFDTENGELKLLSTSGNGLTVDDFSVQNWGPLSYDAPDINENYFGNMHYLNMTGAELGGIKETSTGYVIPFSYDEEGGQNSRSGVGTVKNIHVAFISKRENEVPFRTEGTLIEYDKSGTVSAGCPVIVSLGLEDGGYIFWEEFDKDTERDTYSSIKKRTVNYVKYDAYGKISEISSFEGNMSDCAPLYHDGKIIWYVTNGTAPLIYTFDAKTEKITTQYVSGGVINSINTKKISKVALEYLDQTCIVENKYDSDNRVIQKILKDYKTGDKEASITYNYDINGNKVGGVYKDFNHEYIFEYSKNIEGLISRLEYKEGKNSNNIKEYYDNGELKYVRITWDGFDAESEYDEKTRIIHYKSTNTMIAGNVSKSESNYEYYDNDIVKKHISFSETSDSETNMVKTISEVIDYDENGNILCEKIKTCENDVVFSDCEDQYTYDENGKVIKWINTDFLADRSTIYEYDSGKYDTFSPARFKKKTDFYGQDNYIAYIETRNYSENECVATKTDFGGRKVTIILYENVLMDYYNDSYTKKKETVEEYYDDDMTLLQSRNETTYDEKEYSVENKRETYYEDGTIEAEIIWKNSSEKEETFSKHYDTLGVFDREDYSVVQRREDGIITWSYSESTGYDYDGQITYVRSSENNPSEYKTVEEVISYTDGIPTQKTTCTMYNYVVYEMLTYTYENGLWVLKEE